jgi:hypothetical protein
MLSPAPPFAPSAPDERAVKILAKSIHRELDRLGWDERDMTKLATEILSLVASELEAKSGDDRVRERPEAGV